MGGHTSEWNIKTLENKSTSLFEELLDFFDHGRINGNYGKNMVFECSSVVIIM